MNPIKKELNYSSFEELVKYSKNDFKNVAFSHRRICTSLLKIYDQGISFVDLGDEESAYLLLMRFFEAIQLLRKSKLYKTDKDYVDGMINLKKLTNTLETLEKIKASLVKRYKEKEAKSLEEINKIVEQSQKVDLETSGVSSLKISDKTFITPTEFKDCLSNTEFKFLIIDIRSKNEFDYSHINLNILLTDAKKKQSLINYMNLPNEIIENVSWKLEESLKKFDTENSDSKASELFEKRNEYDYLVLFDRDSTRNLKLDSKLFILKKAIYEFDQNCKLKHEPLILDGGWISWVKYFPGFSTSSNTNGHQPVIQNDEVSEISYKKILNFDYPELSMLIQPRPAIQDNKNVIYDHKSDVVPDVKSAKLDETSENGDQSKSNIASIPVVNRSNKPGSIKPLANETTKPTSEIDLEIKNDFGSSKIKKTLFNPPPNVQFDHNLPPAEPIRKPLNIQSIVNLEPVIPQQIFKSPSNQAALPNIKPPAFPTFTDSNNIFDSVYKPSTRLNTFQIPLMKDGSKKVLDPVTGVFKIYADAPMPKSSSQPTQFKSENITNNENIKPEIDYSTKPNIEFKKNNEQVFFKPKSSLKRTLSIPNIASLNEDSASIKDMGSNDEEEKENLRHFSKESRKSSASKLKSRENLPVDASPKQTPSIIAKPNFNRKTKPSVDDTKLYLRIQELDPVYADVSPGLCGIRNFGNTCFMNCIIQCLNSSRYLVDFFLNGYYKKDLNRSNQLGFGGDIANEFAVLVTAIWNGHCKVIAPKRFKSIIGQFNEQFLSNEQQDSQEFLLFLLDGLHEDLNRVRTRPKSIEHNEDETLSDYEASKKAWSIHQSINDSIIVDLFQGQFKSSITCSFCYKQSVKFDAFMYLTLPILPSKCNVYQCLQMFLKAENMVGECQWKCPRCKTYRDAVKKIDIWKLPPYLIIHLKRFKYQGLWRDKITTFVDYPIEDLQLHSFVLNNKRNESFSYKLYGISNHTGTLDGGHYTAFCRHLEKDRWFRYDDSDVKEVYDKSTLKSSSSYILFYSLI